MSLRHSLCNFDKMYRGALSILWLNWHLNLLAFWSVEANLVATVHSSRLYSIATSTLTSALCCITLFEIIFYMFIVSKTDTPKCLIHAKRQDLVRSTPAVMTTKSYIHSYICFGHLKSKSIVKSARFLYISTELSSERKNTAYQTLSDSAYLS